MTWEGPLFVNMCGGYVEFLRVIHHCQTYQQIFTIGDALDMKWKISNKTGGNGMIFPTWNCQTYQQQSQVLTQEKSGLFNQAILVDYTLQYIGIQY